LLASDCHDASPGYPSPGCRVPLAAIESRNRALEPPKICAGRVVTYRHFDGVVEVSESMSLPRSSSSGLDSNIWCGLQKIRALGPEMNAWLNHVATVLAWLAQSGSGLPSQRPSEPGRRRGCLPIECRSHATVRSRKSQDRGARPPNPGPSGERPL
jgi:hypothetical protein